MKNLIVILVLVFVALGCEDSVDFDEIETELCLTGEFQCDDNVIMGCINEQWEEVEDCLMYSDEAWCEIIEDKGYCMVEVFN